MWSHTRSLELLVPAATVAPAELVRVATSFRHRPAQDPARTARLGTAGVPAAYWAVTGAALAAVATGGFTPGYLTAWRTGPLGIALAVAGGITLVWAEFALVAAPRLLRGARDLRLSVNAADTTGPALLAAILLTAVAEEVLYRGLWIGVLHERLHLPTALAVCFAALGYALGHLFFGGLAVLQKTLSGTLFGLLLVASGSLTVPLVAHLGQNLAVYALARQGARQ